MSKGSTRRPGTIPAGAWEAILNADPDEPCRPQCGDCNGTRRVKGEPCKSCAPTDADDVPLD